MMRLLRRFLVGLAFIVVVGVGFLFAIAPASLDYTPAAPSPDADVDGWLAAREARVRDLTPILENTEKRVRWYGPVGEKTSLSVIYLHGFSATRQEVAPVGEMVAEALRANLFETRLAGHGLTANPLANVRAEDWLDDGAEALAVGAAIGERVVLMGTSTGGTLAIALADLPAFDTVTSVVLMSPNFGLPDPSTDVLTWPGGPQLAQAMIGETRSWTAANEAQERYWSTTYPTAAIVEMMRLVKRARHRLPIELKQSVLTMYSPNDTVVDVEWVRRAAEMIVSPHADLIEIERSGDPSNHVLAGDILSRETNQIVSDHVVRFVRAAGAD